MAKKSFMFGALMLSASGILVKIIGIYFKIPLTNLVGAQYMSHFGSAYEVYNFFLSIATSGLPVGISVMISSSVAKGRYTDVKTLMRSIFMIFISIGLFLTVLGLLFSSQIAIRMNSIDTVYSVRAIIPAIFFMSVVSVLRGFFQGRNNMVPTALSNVVEAFIKLSAGYGIALFMNNNGFPPEQVVAGGIFGVTLGTVGSMLFLIVRYAFEKKNPWRKLSSLCTDVKTPHKELLKSFFVITIPIILSSVTVHLMGLIDALSVMSRLKGFMPESAAQLCYGAYSSMALTVFNLPSFIIISIGVSLVPSISAAFAKKDTLKIQKTFNSALKFSSMFAFACAFGLSGIASYAINLLYRGEGTDIASSLLGVISFALVAVGLTNITSYMLQAIGKSYLSVVSVTVGAVVKSLLTYILVGNPHIGIYGAPIATNIAYPVMLILNLFFIYKNVNITPDIMAVFIKPAISGLGCYANVKMISFVFDKYFGAKLSVLPVILLSGVVYIALLYLLKLFTLNEIAQIFRKSKKKY